MFGRLRRGDVLRAVGALVIAVAAVGIFLWGVIYADPTKSTSENAKDWIDVLLIPLVLGVGALWFTRAQQRRQTRIAGEEAQRDRDLAREGREMDQEIARERNHEETFRHYQDVMRNLMLEKGLKYNQGAESGEAVFATAQTRAALRSLDDRRRGLLIRFLHEASLVGGEEPILELSSSDVGRADLSEADLANVTLVKAFLPGVILDAADLTWADLSEANLFGANLFRADLFGANLSEANLFRANLTRAILITANLSEANLTGADLSEANLSRANLTGANLTGADLSEAYLFGANLNGADLSEANLTGANLTGANLNGADLSEANLTGADLTGANLNGADLAEAIGITAEQLSFAATPPDVIKNLPDFNAIAE